MFNAYFVFHCLNMFCVEKQVSELFATEPGDSPSRETPKISFL